MANLSVELVQQKLLEKDEMKKVSYQKQKLSKHRKMQPVKSIKDPSTKLTKITQVKSPGEENSKEDKGKPMIPQADFAHTYTEKMPHGQAGGTGSSSGSTNQKSPKGASVSSLKPNQKTTLKAVKGAVKGTDDGGGDKKAAALPQADFAYKYTEKMPHGDKNLGTGKGEGGEGQKNPSVANMAGGPTRKGGTRTPKGLGDVFRKDTVTQVKQHSDNMPQPDDSLKWKKGNFKTDTGGSHNVVETGVALKLKGKTKAVFEVVSQSVLARIIKNYRKHGYTIIAERVEPKWKKDKTLMALLRETMHAKHNFVPRVYNNLRKASLNRFSRLVAESHNDLYEDRNDFLRTIIGAFTKIEEAAEQKYINGLEIFECMVRVNIEEGTEADLEIVTEATDHGMALRQVHHQVAEEFGLSTKVEHIFVDGHKYNGRKVCEYKIRNKPALGAFRRGLKKTR